MIIEKINIKSFGMLTDITLEFSNSINVIEGQNEAGKSTIAGFIKYMLYGFDNEDKNELTERRKRINWSTGTAEGSMVVLVKGKRYHISRSTVLIEGVQRDTYKEDCTITDLETGVPVFGKAPAGEVFFGVDRELFENTAFVGQIGDSRINEGSVQESIENILFSGSEQTNNKRAAARVAHRMESLFHKSGRGGIIYDLMKKDDELREALNNAEEDNKKILALEAKLHDIKEEIEYEADRKEKFIDLDLCHRNVLIIQDFDRLHALEAELEAKNEEYKAYVEANTRAKFVPSADYLSDISYARRGVDECYNELVEADRAYTKEKHAIGITKEIEGAIELSDELGGETVICENIKSISKNQLRDIIGMAGGGILALACILIEILAKGVLAHAAFRILFALIGVASVAGVCALVYFYLVENKKLNALFERFSTATLGELQGKIEVIASARAKRDGMIKSTEDARVALEAAKANYERAKQILLAVIVRWGEEPPHSALNDFLDKLEAKVRIYLEGESKILGEKRILESKVAGLRELLSDKSEIDVRGQVSPLKRKVLNDVEHETILNGITECRQRIEELTVLARDIENELSLLKTRAIDPGELYAKMQANDTRIEELKTQHKSYFIALTAIEEASDNLREEISPRLGEFSTVLMGIMTDKKYTSFDVSDGLRVSFENEDGIHKSVDFLSGGTRDLAYIAVRMALIDMLYPEKPPICFDESFAHQDNVRATSMMKAIKALSEGGHQSFIFTCRQREAVIAKDMLDTTEVFRLA